jgi:hypothetical protein
MVRYAAFLCHDRGIDSQGRDNHIRVVRMSRALHSRGIQVWIDDAEMSGDIDTRVCEGIDSSCSSPGISWSRWEGKDRWVKETSAAWSSTTPSKRKQQHECSES